MHEHFALQLPAVDRSPSVARHFVVGVLAAQPAPDAAAASTAELVVSELVTNAVRHACEPIRLELSIDDALVAIEVFDGDRRSERVVPGRPNTNGLSGRGLCLVEALVEHWGVRRRDDGKSVWAELRQRI